MNEVLIIRLPVHIWERQNSSILEREKQEAVDRAHNLLSTEAILSRGDDVRWDGGLVKTEERLDFVYLTGYLLSELDERSRDVLERRFALRADITAPMTLEEIGKVWGLTRERVRQIERKTLGRLRSRALDLLK